MSDLGFYLNGQIYPNNSIVTITDIGVGDSALFCLSDNAMVFVVGLGMEWLVVNGSFLEDLVLLMEVGNLPQLLISVEVVDQVQFSWIEGIMLLDQKVWWDSCKEYKFL